MAWWACYVADKFLAGLLALTHSKGWSIRAWPIVSQATCSANLQLKLYALILGIQELPKELLPLPFKLFQAFPLLL